MEGGSGTCQLRRADESLGFDGFIKYKGIGGKEFEEIGDISVLGGK